MRWKAVLSSLSNQPSKTGRKVACIVHSSPGRGDHHDIGPWVCDVLTQMHVAITSVRVALMFPALIVYWWFSRSAISLNSNKNFSSYLMWTDGRTDGRTDNGEFNSSPFSLREAGNKKALYERKLVWLIYRIWWPYLHCLRLVRLLKNPLKKIIEIIVNLYPKCFFFATGKVHIRRNNEILCTVWVPGDGQKSMACSSVATVTTGAQIYVTGDPSGSNGEARVAGTYSGFNGHLIHVN